MSNMIYIHIRYICPDEKPIGIVETGYRAFADAFAISNSRRSQKKPQERKHPSVEFPASALVVRMHHSP